MPTYFPPAMPTGAYKTYGIDAPRDTHQEEATCEDVGCSFRASGWETHIDEATDLGERQAFYIRVHSGRRFSEARGADGVTVFLFPAGQDCFATHYVANDREPVFYVRGGDHRGNPRREFYVHDSPAAWVEDFAEHQERLERAQE